MDLPIEVGVAIIIRGDTVFIARRKDGDSFSGLWEFPGGGVESEETPMDCVVREMQEEFGIDVVVVRKFELVDYVDKKDGARFRLHSFLCRIADGEPELRPMHSEMQWVRPEELDKYEFVPADLPIVQRLKTERV